MDTTEDQQRPAEEDDFPLPEKTRLQVARDLIVFQAKLFVDGFRDLLLSPISLILGLIGVLLSKNPGEPFYRLLRVGRASEKWLDLFGDAYPEPMKPDAGKRQASSLRELERHLRALETNLTSEDFDKGARESVARIRDTIKRIPFRRREVPRDTDDTADSSG